MANFMGQRLGTVLGEIYLATRMKKPMFPSTDKVDAESSHFRFLLSLDHGNILSPFIPNRVVETHQYPDTPATRLKGVAGKTFKIVTLSSYPLVSDHTFKVHGCLLVDFANQEVTSPINFSLPYEVFAGEPHTFTWKALAR